MSKKNLIIGLGEIGNPILQLLSKNTIAIGYDINQKLMNKKKYTRYFDLKTSFLHICIPFNEKFIDNVIDLKKKFEPEAIVIHSTISPFTTRKIQDRVDIPVIYSATRGVHARMLKDLQRYTKFYAVYNDAPKAKWVSKAYSEILKKCSVKTKKMTDPLTLELAKIVVDTSYYGWLINYAQISNIIAKKYKVDYDEMWSFADEIHKFLGNRPKMFPGYIGGHCVIPNLVLIQEKNLDQINKINNLYLKKVKDAKSIRKKYVKGKQSYDKV